MPTFAAGQPLSGFGVRRALPILAVTGSDITVASLNTVVDIPGLWVQLQAFATYAIDGYIAYTSASAASDIKIALSVPGQSSGSWSALSITDLATGSAGDMPWLRRALEGGGLSEAGGAGGASLAAPVHGYVATRTFPGPLQLRFAQTIVDPTPITVAAGSWLRATQID